MRLQSCATIQYLLEKPRERLTDQDLTIDSPFNAITQDTPGTNL